MDKITKGYIIIMSTYTILCATPVFIFIDKVQEDLKIYPIMLMLIGIIFGILLTPWTYRKTFGRKDLICKINLDDIEINDD